MATGEVRSALSMSEPDLGLRRRGPSDRGDPRRRRLRDTGQKMWLTNGGTSSLVALLAKTDEGGPRPHQNLTAFLVEKDPGFGQTRPGSTVPGQDPQARLPGRGHHRAAPRRLPRPRAPGTRGTAGPGVLPDDGRHRGRAGDVAARGCGVAHRAFELALAYSRQRRTFGKIIASTRRSASSWRRWRPR